MKHEHAGSGSCKVHYIIYARMIWTVDHRIGNLPYRLVSRKNEQLAGNVKGIYRLN